MSKLNYFFSLISQGQDPEAAMSVAQGHWAISLAGRRIWQYCPHGNGFAGMEDERLRGLP